MQERLRYSRTAIALHWGIALLIAFTFGLGQRTEDLPRGAALFAVFQLHKSIGITILLLSLWRLGVRLSGSHPPPLETSGATARAARIVHWLFYVIMIGVPLTGWLIVSTSKTRLPTLLYGLIPWPHLPVSGKILHELAEEVHGAVAQYGIALLLFLHIAGAVRHQILLKERLVERMLPVRRASAVTIAAILATILGTYAIGRFVPVAETLGGVSVTTAKAPAAPRSSQSKVPAVPVALANETDSQADDAAEDEVEGNEKPLATKWTVLPGGRLGFALTVSGQQVSGRFARWDATIDLDPDAPEGGSIRATIDLASVASGDGERDSMLASSDFFAIAAHPRATFASRDIRRLGGNRYQARGTLTIKGVSKPLTLPFTLAASGDTAKVSGSAALDRRSFNVGEGQFSGTEQIGGDVTVPLAFSARRVSAQP